MRAEEARTIGDGLLAEVGAAGGRGVLVPAGRLPELKAELAAFRGSGGLNGFQGYIVDSLYEYAPADSGFPVASLLVFACPLPAYADITFRWKGRAVRARGLARGSPGHPDPEGEVRDRALAFLEARGFSARSAPRLPLKRLAARSGLARYGRNNICYVEGMGSFLAFAALFTDLAAEEGPWLELAPMDECRGCAACLGSCPTRAIRPDRFLIDNERCLSYFNEGPGEFPAWIPASAHHSPYDCLFCQLACPVNARDAGKPIGPFEFDEADTGALLAGRGTEGLSEAAKPVAALLGLGTWPQAIPRNIRTLIAAQGGM